MTFKSMIVTLGTFLLTTGILYLIGHSFSITSLMFQYEFSSDSDGFFISGGSLLPLIIGLIASYLAEKIYVHRHRQE
ncbi:hypothetical protein [Bacillus sp. ISL-37]|uniref:hypothetical protein n=1 Tax=Bacillus sp. ISL-37 TaxID=2819123 RepID=UPI001BEC30D6|nr:hypothetical protein [Bacillus sp. ISL-37]MBT2682706.1 hypothetical protein [Bacillus sp. ISL-37]